MDTPRHYGHYPGSDGKHPHWNIQSGHFDRGPERRLYDCHGAEDSRAGNGCVGGRAVVDNTIGPYTMDASDCAIYASTVLKTARVVTPPLTTAAVTSQPWRCSRRRSSAPWS